MIEKRMSYGLRHDENGVRVTLWVRTFVPNCPAEIEAWGRIQRKLCESNENLTIENANYRRVLYPSYYSNEEDRFVVCTDQADTLIAGMQSGRKSRLPKADSLSFDPWETNPESVGKGYGWFAAESGKKYELTILSKDRQRSLTLTTKEDVVNNLIEIIAPRCPTADLLGLVFGNDLLRRWNRVSKRTERLAIEAETYDIAYRLLLMYRRYLDEMRW
jgi:hypothetical protein